MNEVVSVIIPCYNSESFVAESIESVFQQSYKNLQVIAVDNNSSDNTWTVLGNQKNIFGESLIILKEPKPGAPAARNKGLNTATGKYVQFLDADDVLLPNKIQHQVALFEKEPEAALIAAAYVDQNLEGKQEVKTIKDDQLNNWLNLMYSQFGITSANFWKRENLNEVNGWDESMTSSQEYDLMFRLLKNQGNAIVDNEANTIRMERPFGQISKGNANKRWDNFFQLRKRIVDYLKSYKPDFFQQHKNVLEQALFDSLRILASNDLPKAKQYFKESFPNGYKPMISAGTTASYIRIYNIFGFPTTERIKQLIG